VRFAMRIYFFGPAGWRIMALWFTYYNFCRVHSTLRVTPAMEAGICDHVWSVEELIDLLPENHKIGMQTDKALILKALAR
jgi:hypothetical protein